MFIIDIIRRIQGEPLENGGDLAGDIINNKITTSLYTKKKHLK